MPQPGELFTAILDDATPAFSGAPHTGYGTKRVTSSDLTLADIHAGRLKTRPAPVADPNSLSGAIFRYNSAVRKER